MSHLQAMIITIFVYKVIVPIPGSQRLTCHYIDPDHLKKILVFETSFKLSFHLHLVLPQLQPKNCRYSFF